MAKKHDGDGRSFSEKMCNYLDIQPDVLPHGTLVELRGRTSVTLRGCGRVTEYGDGLICFAVRDGEICVCGERLSCTSYRIGSAVVEGFINSVHFRESAQ